MEPADFDAMLSLNDDAAPHVSALDRTGLDRLAAAATFGRVVVDGDAVVGFLLAMGPGVDYDSPNYRWFADRHDRFLYVDRIVVAPRVREQGIGRLLYGAVFDEARVQGLPLVTCEVNLEPPNPTSLAFHRAMGFEEMGRQRTEGGVKLVVLLARPPT